MQTKLMLSSEDSPVSHSVTPDSEQAYQMTVTSGLKCAGLIKKADPSGLWLRMFLAYSPFWNRIVFLKWKEKRYSYLVRVKLRKQELTQDQLDLLSSVSNEELSQQSLKKLGQTDMYSPHLKMAHQSFCVFQLRVSTPHTDEIESSSLLKTPSAVDGYSENLNKQEQKFGNSGSLAQEIRTGFVYKRGLLPTPTTQEVESDCEITESGRRKTKDGKDSHSLNLGRIVKTSLLPTPRVSDVEGAAVKNVEMINGKFSRKNAKGERWGVKLKDVIASGLLPTPNVVQRDRTDVAIKLAVDGDPLYKRRTKDGKAHQFSIKDAMIHRGITSGLLPTPLQQDSRIGPENFGGSKHRAERGSIALADVLLNLYPTPTKRDYKGMNSKEHLERETGHPNHINQLPNRVLADTGVSGQLNPRFVAEMMGFPTSFTESPFLKSIEWIEI